MRSKLRAAAICGVVGAASCAGVVAPAASARTAKPVYAARASGTTLPLTQRVLAAGQFAGMRPDAALTVLTGAQQWAAGEELSRSQEMTEVARLRKIGFVAGVDENLITPANPDRYGLSSVQQFSSAAGAKSQLAHLLSAGGPWQYFSVSGIPGARGFDSAGSTSGGRNVAFVDGDYLYAEGAGWQGGSNFAVSRSAVSAAARLIYHRVS